MAPGDTARLYHRLTSYAPDREWTTPVDDSRLRHDFEPNDLATLPAQCKAYAPGLPVVDLPRAWPPVPAGTTAVLAGRHATGPAALDLPALARLLHLSAGVVRVSDHPLRGRLLFRAAGSAGGKFPLELYVSARGVAGLEDGVYWYDPAGHALLRVGPPAGGEATVVVVTGVPWRTGWRYSERGLRHIYWDAGTMLSQTLALAASAGLRPRLWTQVPDGAIARLVGADGVHEFPVALVGLGDGAPAIEPRGDAAAGAVDAAPLELPLVTEARHAADGDRLGDPWPAGAPLDDEPPASADLDEVILRRGSIRMLDRAGTVARPVFDWSMAAALRGCRLPHFVAVHAVAGLEPGLYRWPSSVPLRTGDLRDELFRVCMEQELGRDASFVVVAAVDADRLDDRGYLDAQLGAGLVEGRLHLAAYALGIGATGMTFYDSEIAGLLGEPLAGLLLTCVGVPLYRNRRGGSPGAPSEIRPSMRRPGS